MIQLCSLLLKMFSINICLNHPTPLLGIYHVGLTPVTGVIPGNLRSRRWAAVISWERGCITAWIFRFVFKTCLCIQDVKSTPEGNGAAERNEAWIY